MPSPIPESTLEKFTTFGDLLRFLRRRAGITQLELSIAVGYSDAQISRLEQNLRPPDIPTIEARFVPALGLEDEPEAVARLLDLAANVRREDAPGLGLCPYKGLNYFDEVDADLFVGREALIAKLTERILSLASGESATHTRFLGIVGASGSGKSSLVRAGLVPALRWNKASADWHIQIITPTAHPVENLAASLTNEKNSVLPTATLMDDLSRDVRSLQIFAKRKLGSANNNHLLLVIDQFEELFALCRSEEERTSFIGNLLTAASEADGPVMVLITLRADFYSHCANYVQLREALSQNQEFIGAMSDEELRRAIEEPARRGRWEFEPGLVDLILHDVGHEPGALPLLSHSLWETWAWRRGRMMTLGGYTSSGSVRGAIAETAEAVFADQFTKEQKHIARRIFLRLTELGDEISTGDTRRRATFNELILRPEEKETTQIVLKALADARLITTSEDSVEVAHEALIREWPTLRGWLEDNREDLRLHRHLTEAAQEWNETGDEPEMLYRGVRLTQAQEWARTHDDEMNALEREFLAASLEAQEQEAAKREAQRQRELEAAQKLAESERQRADVERQRAEEQVRNAGQLRQRAVYLVGALVIAIIAALTAGIFANRNSTLADQNSAIAQTAQAASTQAIAGFTRSEAQRLAAEANNLMLNHRDSNLIALLTIQSLNMQYTSAGDAMLSNLTELEVPPRVFEGHTLPILDVDISPDGKYLASGGDDGARLWDLATGKTIRIFSGHTAEIDGIAFSPDGKTLATAGWDSTVRLWDVMSGETLQVFSGDHAEVHDVEFSPDGQFVVSVFGDQTTRIWEVASGETMHVLMGFPRVAYSPDGKYILAGNYPARLWDTTTGNEVQVFNVDPEGASAVAYSPDGQYVATGDVQVRLWEAATGQLVREFLGHQDWVSGIEFSPDGRLLLSSSGDKTARLWDVSTGQQLRILGRDTFPIQDVTFSPDGRLAVAAGEDAVVKVWSLHTFPGGMQFRGHEGPVSQASFSRDGKKIVTASLDGTSRIWDGITGQMLTMFEGQTDDVHGAVFSADGTMVLTTSADGTTSLWDADHDTVLRQLEGHTDVVRMAAFSPDGTYAVTTSWDGTARVWDTQTWETTMIYTNHEGEVNRIAFSPDGKTIATSSRDSTARIWDPLTGKDIMVLEGHEDNVTGIAFSSDGTYLVTSSWDGTVRLWDVSTGDEIRSFIGHVGHVSGAAFSPDDKYVLTSGADGTARLWDVQTGQEVRRFIGHTNQVGDVSFSPDGKYILTASNDGTARLWLTDLDETISAVCDLLTRDLTLEERIQFGINDQEPTCPVP